MVQLIALSLPDSLMLLPSYKHAWICSLLTLEEKASFRSSSCFPISKVSLLQVCRLSRIAFDIGMHQWSKQHCCNSRCRTASEMRLVLFRYKLNRQIYLKSPASQAHICEFAIVHFWVRLTWSDPLPWLYRTIQQSTKWRIQTYIFIAQIDK